MAEMNAKPLKLLGLFRPLLNLDEGIKTYL